MGPRAHSLAAGFLPIRVVTDASFRVGIAAHFQVGHRTSHEFA